MVEKNKDTSRIILSCEGHLFNTRHNHLAHVLHEEAALLALVNREIVRVVGEQVAHQLIVHLIGSTKTGSKTGATDEWDLRVQGAVRRERHEKVKRG